MTQGHRPEQARPEPAIPLRLPDPAGSANLPPGPPRESPPVVGWPAQPPAGDPYARAGIAAPRVGSVHVAIAWVMAVITVAYFLPWAVAATRQKSNTLAIALVNFLLGWTFFGWVVALVMACLAEPPAMTALAYVGPPAGPPAGWYPDASGRHEYWDGTRWTGHTAP